MHGDATRGHAGLPQCTSAPIFARMVHEKRALVSGAGGFIGSHLVRRLKADGYWVRGVDLKKPGFGPTAADDFLVLDLLGRWDRHSVIHLR